MDRIIFHIDVNSAYLSWSAIDRLKRGETVDLRTIPAIIGGDEKERRGVVFAKSEMAKACGVRTGEPVSHALRKCPGLVMIPPDRALYKQYSERLMSLLSEYTDELEQISIDECFLDYTHIARGFSSPVAAACQIKDRVREELGFTVNVGVAPNKLLAKMASDFQKPDRVHTLYREEIPSKMWPLPVSELYMVGQASAGRLNGFGIRTIGELAAADPEFLQKNFKKHGMMMWEYANGIDDSPVNAARRAPKGIGNSTTLRENAVTEDQARQVLLSLAEEVSRRLRAERQIPGTVTVEIKYHDFTSVSHQRRPQRHSNATQVIYEEACDLFHELWNGEPIRLLGIRTSSLTPEDEPSQISIFDYLAEADSRKASGSGQEPASADPAAGQRLEKKQRRLDQALDQIRKRYGKNAVVRGSMMRPAQAGRDLKDSGEQKSTKSGGTQQNGSE